MQMQILHARIMQMQILHSTSLAKNAKYFLHKHAKRREKHARTHTRATHAQQDEKRAKMSGETAENRPSKLRANNGQIRFYTP